MDEILIRKLLHCKQYFPLLPVCYPVQDASSLVYSFSIILSQRLNSLEIMYFGILSNIRIFFFLDLVLFSLSLSRLSVNPGRANFFYGNRYAKGDGDDATRLIFDCDGSLAGIQATVRTLILEDY